MKTWIKYGLIIGIPIGIIMSICLVTDTYPFNLISSPAVYSCIFLTQCGGEECMVCLFLGPIISLFYGFIIGSAIGLIAEKIKSKQ